MIVLSETKPRRRGQVGVPSYLLCSPLGFLPARRRSHQIYEINRSWGSFDCQSDRWGALSDCKRSLAIESKV